MELDVLNKELRENDLEIVIGLETHIRLNTKTKLFCSCPSKEEDIPNQNICSICTGQMGVLPSLNPEAIRKAILFGKAINSNFSNRIISWDRKHYEYPDLPKNFQLTQFMSPVIPDGIVECYRNDGSVFRVEIQQVHIEEDAAKLIHDTNQTLVDFNKGGVPLIEIVTKPCIYNISDASIYAQYLQRIVQNLKISEANLEKGQFKSDVSVSLRVRGSEKLNPRAEIKNLNSFKFMHEAIVEEVRKQLSYYKKNKEFRPNQITVLFDSDLKQTKTMRQKEYDADYRYIAEPDIPYVDISKTIEETEIDHKLLPFNIEKQLIEGGVRPQDAKFFTSDVNRVRIIVGINNEINDPLFTAKILTNNLSADDYDRIIKTEPFIEIIKQYKEEKLSVELMRKAFSELIQDPDFDYTSFIEKNTISDQELSEIVLIAIKENSAIADEIIAGKTNKAGILVGKVLSKTSKSVSGKLIREKILVTLGQTSRIEYVDKGPAITDKLEKSERIDTIEEKEKERIFVKEGYRTHLISDISENSVNTRVRVAGWVSSLRDHGEIVFIDFRDSVNELLQIRFDRSKFPDLKEVSRITPESVIMVTGNIVIRQDVDFNPGIRTGTVELAADSIEMLNRSQPLPFEIRKAKKVSELIRLKYKFLDHRNQQTHRTIENRYKVIKTIRDILHQERFIEIETPILTAGTDEGAREFIIPSRKFPGKFYTLPQAPQQFKQMLMVSGYERYFQIARCFRDEDSRGDRQAEFTQLDMEMAFIGMDDIIDLNTRLFEGVVNTVYAKKWKLFPFRTLTYFDAMEKYGTDRPDLRFGLEMQDITDIVKETSFKIFTNPISKGGVVKCIRVSGENGQNPLSKGQVEKLTYIAQSLGLGGLAYIVVKKDELQSPIIKYLGEEIAVKIIERTDAQIGDIVFFSAADYKTANKALDAVRQELGRMLNLINPKELHPAWVIDFPLFEETDKGKWSFSHNPFSMPKKDFIKEHIKGENIGGVIAQQYDLILNGNEIGGGSIRAHKPEILEATYRNMGYDYETMRKSIGHLLDAFQYGAPPHGGIAWGIDRLMMILENMHSIREVIAFPKTGAGEDLLFNCPAEISEKKIVEANIRIAENE
jgi:aspartyl-tRNA synthetase